MYNTNGSIFSSEFQANTFTAGYQANPSITGLNDGKFVVAWMTNSQDGSEAGVYAQMYNANGTRFLSEFQVNTYTANNQWWPYVTGLSDNKFVVIWESGSASSPPFQDGYG